MEDFVFQNTAKIIFGKETEKKAGSEIKKFGGKKVLLHYGGGSIKKTGLYDRVISSLRENGLDFIELGGVLPNPFVSLVRKGIRLCKENKVDFILAVGGGSVIDSAKAISIGCNYEGDVWDFFEGKAEPEAVVPIGVVLTIPAAGSESSVVTVITNEDLLIKRGYHSDALLPKFAILNPELTMTLPLFQIACGASDIIAHTLERYFTPTKNRDLTDRLCEGLMMSVIKNAEFVLSKGKPDYDSMAELMWASTIAHNGILGTGRKEDWATHKFGHELSALFGITHGASLSIMFPAWMKYVYMKNLDLFVQFAERVFSVNPEGLKKEKIALKGIECLEKFYIKVGLPTRLSETEVDLSKIDEMAEKIVSRGPVGNLVKIEKADAIKIYRLAI